MLGLLLASALFTIIPLRAGGTFRVGSIEQPLHSLCTGIKELPKCQVGENQALW